MYRVIVCPDKRCRGVSIVEGTPSQTKCSRCHSGHVLDKFRTSYKADTKDNARIARSKLIAKLRDDGASFEELQEMGALDDENVERVFDKRDKEEKDTRTPQEKIRHAVDTAEPATRQNIIELAEESELSREKAEKLLSRLTENGHALKTNGEYTLL